MNLIQYGSFAKLPTETTTLRKFGDDSTNLGKAEL